MIEPVEIEFLNEPFEIKEENKIEVFRFNLADKSPYISIDVQQKSPAQKWDYNAKGIKTAGPEGIFGVTAEQVNFDLTDVFLEPFQNQGSWAKNITFLQLDVDKTDIFLQSAAEVAFSKGNLVKVLTLDEFVDLFPSYKDIVFWYKKTQEADQNDYFRYEKHFSEAIAYKNLNKNRKWLNPQNGGLVHGITHAARVANNGFLLSKNTYANRRVVGLFAYYHDLCRLNDGGDAHHGRRAAELIRKKRGGYGFLGVTDKEIDELCFACENHTHMLRSGNPTIDTCFDADRLDLTRCGITPEPELMATETGAYYARNMELLKILTHVTNFD